MKKIYFLLVLISVTLLVGCGGGGGSDSPVYPTPDLPTEYEPAPVFNKAANEIYNHKSNAGNVAIDLPIGSTYLVSITNTSGNYQNIEIVASLAANIRASITDEPQQSALVNFADSYRHQERSEAEMQYRLGFINSLRAKSNNNKKVLRSTRAGISGVDHSYEIVGETYTIYTSDTNGNPVPLNNVKLVAETAHAKFFVDQNSRMGYSPQVDLMERVVTEGPFALTNVFDSDSVNIYKFMQENFGDFYDVDNDGKVSVIITPYLSTISSSILGLFMNHCLLETFEDPRDQILIAPPIGNALIKGENYIRYETITNLCHEYQHLVNFSKRYYRDGHCSFSNEDSIKYQQELGFDEGCSVCSEALFRRERGKQVYGSLFDHKTGGTATKEYTGNDPRFSDCFDSGDGNFDNVFPFYKTGMGTFPYKNYGRNGLFFLYLHDRFFDSFKKLIELPFTGNNLKEVIPQSLGVPNLTLDDLQRDWHFALQHEYLLTELKKEGEAMTTDARFKYNDWLRLPSQNKTLEKKYLNISLSKGYTTLLKIKPDIPSSVNNTFRFFIKPSGSSPSKNLEINIIKL